MSNGLGIGIGAFASGFAGGIGLADRIEDNRARKEEREAARQNRERMQKFDTDSRAEFDKLVASGEKRPADIADFMLRYKGPERTALFIEQGDYKSAKEWTDWYRSEGAQEGSRLFGSALFKAEAGDLRGAIDDAIKAGKTKGYLDHSYSVAGEEEIRGSDGSLAGYRVKLRDGDGMDVTWEVTPENVVNGIASIFNPEAAFQSRLDAAAARQKADLEVETYGKKEGIKDQYSRGREILRHNLKVKEGASGAGKAPAEVQAAEWLATKTAQARGREATPQDYLDAHKTIRQAKDNPTGRAGLVMRAYEAMTKDFDDNRTPDEKRKAAREFVDDLMAEGEGGGGAGGAGGGEGGDGTNSPYRPTSDAEYEKIPAGALYIDPDDGQIYTKRGR